VTVITTATEYIMELLGQMVEIMNTARNSLGGCGTQTAALAFGGYTNTSYNSYCKNMEWNFLDYSMKFKYSKRNMGAAGTQTAGLAFGGYFLLLISLKNMNGSTWTTGE
jgi:hypothetical protein